MSTRLTPELSPRQIPELAALRSSGHRQFKIPGFRIFVTPLLHRIKIPEICTFANSRLHKFQASENRELTAPEKHASRTLLNSTFSRVTGFPKFFNTGRNTPHLVGVREQRRRQCYEQFNQPIAPPSVDTHRGFAPTRPGKGNARRSLIKTQATCAARPPPRQHRRPGSANATCLSHSRYKKPRATSRVLRCIAAAPNKQTPLSH
jgi:hypothetical protein